jgi:hypothetical protein
MALQPAKAIYYPHVEFGSAAWLKSVLFYWEGIVRHTPEGAAPRDDREVRALADAGLVTDYPVPRILDRSLDIVGPRIEEMAREHDGALPPCVRAIDELRGVERGYVTEKVEDMARAFRARGWSNAASAVQKHVGQAFALHATVINAIIAHDLNLAPVTDDSTFDAACTYFPQGKVTDRPSELAEAESLAAAQLFVPTPAAEACAKLSVEDLVRVRHKLASARRRFRESVQARVHEIAALPTADAVRDSMASLATAIRDDLAEAREALREANVKERWSMLGVSASASLSVGVALAGQSIAGPIGTVASAALAVSTWFFQHHKPQHEPAGNYLLSAERAVEGTHVHGLSDAMKRLFSR